MGDVELVDPLEASRHPFEIYLLVLAAVSALPRLLGRSNSTAIEQGLEPWVVLGWNAMLLTGSLIALAGLYWPGRSATGLILERSGLVGVGGAALVYSTVVFISIGVSGAFSGCIIAAFGLACFNQAHRINHRINQALRRVPHEL